MAVEQICSHSAVSCLHGIQHSSRSPGTGKSVSTASGFMTASKYRVRGDPQHKGDAEMPPKRVLTRYWEATSQLRPLHLQIKNCILAKSSYVFF